MRKFAQFITDSWEVIGVFAGVAIMVYEFAAQLYAAKGLSLNNTVWLGLGVFVFFGIAAIIKANRKAREAQNSKPANNIQIQNPGDGIAAKKVVASPVVKLEGGENNVGINYGTINRFTQQIQQDETFDISPSFVKNDRWASIVVPNPINSTIECYCSLVSVELNGKLNEKIRRYVTEHISRVSLSGGNINGKEEGIIVIDNTHEGKFNLITPSYNGLVFEMAKGSRCLDHAMQYGTGKYRVVLDLRYKSSGDKKFQSKILDVNFSCYIESGINESQLDNIIKSDFGAGSLVDFADDNKVNDKLCIRIYQIER